MASILCAGHAAFDLLLPLEGYPEENRKYHLERTETSSGGPAANAASLLGRWGAKVAILAPIGDDAFGDIVRAELAADGVDTSALAVAPGLPTPFSVILANAATGSRTILTRKAPRPPLALDAAVLDSFGPRDSVAGLLFDGHEPEASAALMDRYPRAWSLLDAGTLRPGTESLARRVDYLIASESFARSLAEREGIPAAKGDESAGARLGVDALRRLSRRWVCFTRGERGCVWQAAPGDPVGSMAALQGPVADTTGAGDVFHGAFAYGLLAEGIPERALRWAAAAAGLSVRRRGGRASIPSLEETKEAMRFREWG